jgi:hypothetical protein
MVVPFDIAVLGRADMISDSIHPRLCGGGAATCTATHMFPSGQGGRNLVATSHKHARHQSGMV